METEAAESFAFEAEKGTVVAKKCLRERLAGTDTCSNSPRSEKREPDFAISLPSELFSDWTRVLAYFWKLSRTGSGEYEPARIKNNGRECDGEN